MAALTAARVGTKQYGTQSGIPEMYEIPQKGSTTLYPGAGVVLNAGYAAPATTAAGLISVGRCESLSANTGADGAVIARIRPGVFPFNNSAAGDAIAQADVGADCYWVDDNTVAKTSNSSARSRAGKIIKVDSDGVWVQLAIGL